MIDVAVATERGRITFPPNNIADEVEKCSWDNMCAGCAFCKVDDIKEASCMEFCALLATKEVTQEEVPWKTQTLPWETICAWGGCHGTPPPRPLLAACRVRLCAIYPPRPKKARAR